MAPLLSARPAMIPRPLSAAVEPCHASLLMLCLICAAPAQEPRPTTATLMGRVVDPRGEPVVQAQVRAMAAFHDEPLVTQKTDGSGFFTLKGLPLDDTLQVAASAPGHARAAVWLTPTRQLETLDQDLTLRSAGNITGVVVDGSGQPIGGACVSAAAAFAQPRVEAVETTTDAQGRFALDAVPLGEVLLMAWKRGFVLQERQLLLRERCEEQLVLSDKGGARLAVRVEGLTSDADRASVKLRLQRFVDNWSQALPTPLGLCSLGESDSFTVDGLLPGQYQMIPHSPRVSVRVRSGEAPAAVPLLGMTATPRDAQLTLTEGAVQEVCFVAAAPAAVRISGVLGAADNFWIAGKLLRFSSTNGVRIPSVRTDSAGAFALTASLSVGETLWPRLLDDEHFLMADRLQGGALVEGKQ